MDMLVHDFAFTNCDDITFDTKIDQDHELVLLS